MSSIRQLKKWLFGDRKVQVQIVGGEEAGKTTMLYTLKNRGGPPTEIPSPLIPYNRETIEYPAGWEFDIVDIWEGCSLFNMKHGPFHFMTSETIVWCVHDCSFTDGAVTLYVRNYVSAMKKKGAKYLWVVLSKQDKLPAGERAGVVAEHKGKLVAFLQEHAAPAGITWFVVDEPGFNLLEGAKYVLPFVKGVTRTLLEIEKQEERQRRAVVNQNDKGSSSSPSDKRAAAAAASNEEASLAARQRALGDEVLRARLEQVEKGEGGHAAAGLQDVDSFWDDFTQARLASWTHVDHLEAGYLVLLRSMAQRHGLLRTASTFLEHLARLREARPDVFRNSAHFTMTAFWIIQLRIAAFNFQFEAKQDAAVPVAQDFRGVLLHSPSLLDTRLWTQYYTKEVLFSPQAREDFVMPDVKPFPQVTKPVLASMVGKEEKQEDESPEEEEQE